MTLTKRMRELVDLDEYCDDLESSAADERDALYDLLIHVAAQLREARLEHDWLTVSNVECAIKAALKVDAK